MHRWREKKYNLIFSAFRRQQIFEELAQSNSPGHAQQASDLNCSDLMDTSQSGNTSTEVHSFDRLVVDSTSTTLSTSASETVFSDTQSIINQTILQQLTAVGERLEKIEQKTVIKHRTLINQNVEVQ